MRSYKVFVFSKSVREICMPSLLWVCVFWSMKHMLCHGLAGREMADLLCFPLILGAVSHVLYLVGYSRIVSSINTYSRATDKTSRICRTDLKMRYQTAMRHWRPMRATSVLRSVLQVATGAWESSRRRSSCSHKLFRPQHLPPVPLQRTELSWLNA